jgi:hypothetical protein
MWDSTSNGLNIFTFPDPTKLLQPVTYFSLIHTNGVHTFSKSAYQRGTATGVVSRLRFLASDIYNKLIHSIMFTQQLRPQKFGCVLFNKLRSAVFHKQSCHRATHPAIVGVITLTIFHFPHFLNNASAPA